MMGESVPEERDGFMGELRLVQSFMTPARGLLVLKGGWTMGLKAFRRGRGDDERCDIGLCA